MEPTLELELEQARAGDVAAWHAIVTRHHARLRRMVDLRLDQRLRGRIDPSDVLQDAYIQAHEELPRYLDDHALPFFIWLRQMTLDQLSRQHRYHLGAQMRDVRRELPLERLMSQAEASSAAMAAQLLGNEASPLEAAESVERRVALQQALDQLDSFDREVLAMKHFEQLNSTEIAEIMGKQEATVRQRYLRALRKLKQLLADSTFDWDTLPL